MILIALFSLYCNLERLTPSRGDTYVQITANEYKGREVVEHVWVLVIEDNRVIRADPEISYIVGYNWEHIRQQCLVYRWTVLELQIKRTKLKPQFRFRIR